MNQQGDWTLEALKEYVERILDEREKRWDDNHIATRLAVTKAESALEHRLDLLNEYRQQAVMDQVQYVSRSEFDALEKRYEEKHAVMVTEVRLLQARVIPMLWVGSTLVLSVIGVFISHIVTGRP